MNPSVTIQKTKGKGRGVFAAKNFKKGQLIESCPVIPLTFQEDAYIQKTVLGKYVYEWRSPRESALVLGYGSLYNHSYTPNAVYSFDYSRQLIEYTALTYIPSHQEITVNYTGTPTGLNAVEDFTPVSE